MRRAMQTPAQLGMGRLPETVKVDEGLAFVRQGINDRNAEAGQRVAQTVDGRVEAAHALFRGWRVEDQLHGLSSVSR